MMTAYLAGLPTAVHSQDHFQMRPETGVRRTVFYTEVQHLAKCISQQPQVCPMDQPQAAAHHSCCLFLSGCSSLLFLCFPQMSWEKNHFSSGLLYRILGFSIGPAVEQDT